MFFHPQFLDILQNILKNNQTKTRGFVIFTRQRLREFLKNIIEFILLLHLHV